MTSPPYLVLPAECGVNYMKDYFILQFTLLSRYFSDARIHPFLGWGGILALIFVGSFFIFQRTEYASYILVIIVFGIFFRLADEARVGFLKQVFGIPKFYVLRCTENLLTSIPFLFVLIYKLAFLEALLILAGVFLVVSSKSKIRFTLPTPFYNYPFEFTVGFRKTFFLFPLVYALMVVSIWVGNANLGLASVVGCFLIILTFYHKPEDEYYVWVYSKSPSKFLLEKQVVGLVYSLILTTPMVISLLYFFPDLLWKMLVGLLVCVVFLITFIFAKYTAYPHEMNLPEGILLAFGLTFPPLLLVMIPYFYYRSVRRLSYYLK